MWGAMVQGVHVFSWRKATFGSYHLLGKLHSFLLACTLLKPRVKD
jgi:hypothetical protein